MTVKEFKDRFLYLLSVPTCIHCHKRLDFHEKAFCKECQATFDNIKTRECSRCAKRLSFCSCSNSYLESHFVKRVIKVFRYLRHDENDIANRLIFSLKRNNRSDVLEVCANELEAAIRNSVDPSADFVFTNVPRRTSAILKYGIDHSQLLSNELARRFSSKHLNLLKSKAKTEQKKQHGINRQKNADFVIKKKCDLSGKCVIIVDDVITSGASMSVAASLLRSLGAKEIIAASLAIAYKDDYEFDYKVLF